MAITSSRSLKTFKVSVDTKKPPIPFEIEFTKKGTGHPGEDGEPDVPDEVEVHTFEAYGNVGAGGTFAVSSLVRYNARGEQLYDLNAFMRFFERVLPPEDYSRLAELNDRRDLEVELELLSAIFQWLTEEYSGRPTKQS